MERGAGIDNREFAMIGKGREAGCSHQAENS